MNRQKILQKPWVVCILACVCCTLWGSAFPCIKIGYELLHIPSDSPGSQILFAGYRFTLAGILTVLLGSLISRRFLIPKKTSYGNLLKLCMMQTVIQYFFFYIGLAHTSGVKGSIITGTNTLLSILIASLLFRQEKLTAAKLLGCAAGLFGVLLANWSGGNIDFSFSLQGEGFVFLSALSYAFSSVYIKKYSAQEDPVVLSGYQFFLGGLILIVAGLSMGGRIHGFTLPAAAMLLYLAFLSAIAYSLWGILLKYNPVSKVTIYGFMNPVIGVLLSALFLGEGGQAFQAQNILALLFVSLGIFIVNKWNSR